MSKKVLDRLSSEFGDRILETRNFRGDEEAVVAAKDWAAVATFLRDDEACSMNQFTDITAVDYPEREPEPRFDLLLLVRSMSKGHRIRLRTALKDGQKVPTLVGVWDGANWTEREVFDMFGIEFDGHPDQRRILLYKEFVGYPLRKDYPIDKVQPLVAYRDVPSAKLEPFGKEEGQPWSRIEWQDRLGGGNKQVSPAIGVQQGQRSALSESTAASTPSAASEEE